MPPMDVDATGPDNWPDSWPEWPDESTRPRVTDPAEARTGHPNQQLLTQVHAHLRDELARITETLEQLVAIGPDDDVVARDAGVGDVRAFLSRMAGRQNSYSLGAFCAAYCRTVATHHAIEDARLFPDIAAADPALRPVVDRLESEHLVIAAHLDALDRAVVGMVAADGGGPTGTEAVHGAAAALTRVLGSHLDYEEEQLLGPLGRLPLVV